MILGNLLLIVYFYTGKINQWPSHTVYITFTFLLVDNWSGLFYTFGTRLEVGFFVLR
jgi:hypothetical protein